MDLYTLLRVFADSWGLVFLTAVFLGAIIWVFRPGSKKTYQDIASSVLENEDHPIVDEESKK